MPMSQHEIIEIMTMEAPVNVDAIAHELGIVVRRDEDLAGGISGHLKRLPDGMFEIAANRDEHPFRQRFTIAHEIGHFVLHRNLVERHNGVDDDRMYRSTSSGRIYNTSIKKNHERQANSFAANLLMPKDLLRSLFLEIEKTEKPSLSQLYRKFQVSAPAMRWRLNNLGIYEKCHDDAA